MVPRSLPFLSRYYMPSQFVLTQCWQVVLAASICTRGGKGINLYPITVPLC